MILGLWNAISSKLRYRKAYVQMSFEDQVGYSATIGYTDPACLRELLIGTTSKNTYDVAMTYFRAHLNDERLLAALMPIALEGEDMGDAPWAAANVIAEFSAPLLVKHETELKQIADEQWDYLNKPAKEALAKIAALLDR